MQIFQDRTRLPFAAASALITPGHRGPPRSRPLDTFMCKIAAVAQLSQNPFPPVFLMSRTVRCFLPTYLSLFTQAQITEQNVAGPV